ncbi:hypothetical protein UFOVP315_11 [uncultured Caudovirales phage]|uniref:Uncharacterized protein n=1 Tax=uncultured Caudovirales phage TaxID=2100421 RepID=A0A6J5LV79_9CAUD|nr:hypothetical protein UFOVP315_11 [uncultured Caudovirales phage]
MKTKLLLAFLGLLSLTMTSYAQTPETNFGKSQGFTSLGTAYIPISATAITYTTASTVVSSIASSTLGGVVRIRCSTDCNIGIERRTTPTTNTSTTALNANEREYFGVAPQHNIGVRGTNASGIVIITRMAK